MDTAAAKKLFFDYDGSTFYMSRDGVDTEYHRARVSAKTEAVWFEELRTQKLQRLAFASNWRTINFLEHHGDYSHLDRLVSVEPLGTLLERIIFLEQLRSYAGHCQGNANAELISAAVHRVVTIAQQLRSRCRSAATRKRLDALVKSANVRSRRESSS